MADPTSPESITAITMEKSTAQLLQTQPAVYGSATTIGNIEDDSLRIAIGRQGDIEWQIDILKQYSKITSLQQDDGITPHFGPRTSLWL
jgi:hypothetical protein